MQNARARLRLRYKKDDVLRYIGHRDLLRYAIKLLRRAEVPYALSEGFSPKPRLVFGPALPLGVLADNELLDIELKDGVMPDAAEVAEIGARLAAVASPRDFVVHLSMLDPADPPLSKLARGSRYQISEPAAVELLGAALAAGELPVDDRDGGGTLNYCGRVAAWRAQDDGLELDGANGDNALNITVLTRWVAAQTAGGYIPDARRKCLLDPAGNEL